VFVKVIFMVHPPYRIESVCENWYAMRLLVRMQKPILIIKVIELRISSLFMAFTSYIPYCLFNNYYSHAVYCNNRAIL